MIQLRAAMITPAHITAETLVSCLMDPLWRTALRAALAAETGSTLPLHNALHETAPRAHAKPEQLRLLVKTLLAEELDGVLEDFLFHPDVPQDVLLALCDAGQCISALGHRPGPRTLLARLVDRYEYPEALLSLAIDLYRDPGVAVEEFARLVNRFAGHDWMLRALAECEASEAGKRWAYEAVLLGNLNASAFHARHLAVSARYSVDELSAFLHRHTAHEVLVRLLLTPDIEGEKRRLIEGLAAERNDCAEIAAALLFRQRLARAGAATLSQLEAESLLATDDPGVLFALAGNPNTPRSILEFLALRAASPSAGKIRRHACATLRQLKC